MKVISYLKLYRYFIEKEELPAPAALRNIWRVSNLPKEFKEVIAAILDKKAASVGDFACQGITLRSLVEKEGMKSIQAVMFLDWVRREPVAAVSFMHTGRLRPEMKPLTKEEKEVIKKAMSRIEAMKSEKDHWNPGKQYDTKEDIPVEDAGKDAPAEDAGKDAPADKEDSQTADK